MRYNRSANSHAAIETTNSPDQVEPHASRLRTQQEDEALRLILPIESIHRLLPLLLRGTAVQAKVRVLPDLAQILKQVECRSPVRYDNDLLLCDVVIDLLK